MTRRSTSSGSPAGDAEQAASSSVAAAASIVPLPRRRREPGSRQRLVERAVLQVGGQDDGAVARTRTRGLDRHRLGVGAAQPADVRRPRLAGREAERGRLGLGRRADRRARGAASSASRPRRRISRVKVISRSARRWVGGSATKLPRPGWRATRPSSARRCIALRAVIRLTPNSACELRVGGQPVTRPERRRSARAGPARCGGSAAGRRSSRSRRGAAPRPWTPAPIGAGPVPSARPGTIVDHPRASVVVTRRGDLGADRVEQQVAGRGDPAADDHPVGRDDDDHVGDADAQVAPDPGQPGQRPLVAGAGRLARPPPPSSCRTPRRSGRPGRRPRGSRGCRSCTTARPGSIVWWPTSPAVPSWPGWTLPSMAMTPPTPVPRVSPTIELAPRPAPSRSSASPNARASLMSATGMPSAVATGGRRRARRPSRPGR